MYLINKKVIFDTCNQTISDPEKGVTEKLTDLQARILNCLIKNVGEAIERNELLNYLWGEDSEKASNNTLNHNISFLRRIFYNTYCHDVILTIHGTGYLLNAEVELLPIQLTFSEKEDNHQSKFAQGRYLTNSFKILSIAVLIYLFTYGNNRLVNDKLNPEGTIKYTNGCKVVTLNKTNSNPSLIYDFIISKNIHCVDTQFFMLFENYHKNTQGENMRHSFLIVKCDESKEVYANCYNWLVREEGLSK